MCGYLRASDTKNAHEGHTMFTRFFSTMIAAGVILAFAGMPAHAQDNIEAKVQVCAVCHGQNGVPLDPKTMPIIWGQTQYYTFKQLSNYRNGMRDHPTMSPLAKGLQQADLRAIAAYFAAKSWPANPAAAAPAAPASPPNGIAMCRPCHQQNFEGGAPAPRLAGLSYEYLIGSMRAFATEERTNNGDMPKIMQMFTDSERDAMARYLAGL
jgi:cytochrome c553